MDREAGAGVLAEILDLVGRAVAVLVAQRRDAAALGRQAQRHVDVAVVAHRDVARPADALGEDLGVEAFGHADAGILVDRRASSTPSWSAWPSAAPLARTSGPSMPPARSAALRIRGNGAPVVKRLQHPASIMFPPAVRSAPMRRKQACPPGQTRSRAPNGKVDLLT